jgi:uncharacterized protein (TIGR03032 family)
MSGENEGNAGQNNEAPLRSVHTTNLPQIFRQVRCSLAVSTYQAGKLVLVRSDETDEKQPIINTHFRTFKKPMGITVGNNRMAIGTAQEIWEFRNVPAVTSKLEPAGKYDACFLPRRVHFTGDIQIHEMKYLEDELWFINTAFSCLCTYDPDHSFTPRWRPKFISALTPGDRCHLNGLEFVDGKPKYVTALGTADVPGGWRENKPSGGVIIDMDSNEIVTRGLSMPHSPRWYADRLWVLESGTGSFGTVDLASGRFEPIIQLPGFTRGLDFVGNLAFIGLSQVRETAVFSGIAITERLTEADRNCGVWVVDIRSGQLVGFLRFEDAVQEIFGVSVIRGSVYPDLIHDDPKIIGASFVLPDEALRDVPAEMKAAGADGTPPGDKSSLQSAKPAESSGAPATKG